MQRPTAALLLLLALAGVATARDLSAPARALAQAEEADADASEASNPYSARFDEQPAVVDAKVGDIGAITVRVLTDTMGLPGFSGTQLPLSTHQVTLGACTSLAPHYHPTADEMQYMVEGNATFGIVDMDGKLHTKAVYPGSVDVIPRGPSHYLANEGCTNATVILVFSGNVSRVNLAPTTMTLGQNMYTDMLGLSNGTVLNSPMGDAIQISYNGCPAKCQAQA